MHWDRSVHPSAEGAKGGGVNQTPEKAYSQRGDLVDLGHRRETQPLPKPAQNEELKNEYLTSLLLPLVSLAVSRTQQKKGAGVSPVGESPGHRAVEMGEVGLGAYRDGSIFNSSLILCQIIDAFELW